jgi:membrane protease YdiL (CAAX protease family)
MSQAPGLTKAAKSILPYYMLLISAWIAAWLFSIQIGLGGESAGVGVIYWTLAKILLWLMPILVIIKLCLQRSILEYLAMRQLFVGAKTGIVCGLIFAAVSFLADVSTKRFILPSIDPGLLNALLIAPVFEEILFRGFILRALQESAISFWIANLITACMFLGIHVPGWYFMDSPRMFQVPAILGIILVGLCAGVSKHISGSIYGSIAFHLVNNMYSLLPG